MGCAVSLIAVALVAAAGVQENGRAAKLAARLEAERDPAESALLIRELVKAGHYPGVAAIISKLDDRGVVARGSRGDYLVCDCAAQSLQRMIGINHERIGPLYHQGSRAERDAGIARWESWWKANKDVPPREWFPQYIDGLVTTVRTAASDRERLKAAGTLDRVLRTAFGVTSFWDNPYFRPTFHACCELAADWWASHRALVRETLPQKAKPLETLVQLAAGYRSFVVRASIIKGRPPLELQPNPVKADRLEHVGKLMATVAKGSPEDKETAIEQIAAILGTDFAWRAYAGDKAFKDELAAIEAYMLDWWDTHKDASPADMQKSLAYHLYLIELARRYAELVKKAKTIP